MNIQMIPLNTLVPSPANVRKTGVKTGIDELAASIAAHGLLQNLQVRPAQDGKYQVVAGARRLAALKLLAKRKELAKDVEIGCNVLAAEDDAEISLAENEMRVAMHPADQFEAFKRLVDEGRSVEDVAARFGVTVLLVTQRLKLAGVSPRLMKLYRDEAMTLEQLMAFTVADDHAAQEAAWFDAPDYDRNPRGIRRRLTAGHVPGTDRRAVFVGLEAYRHNVIDADALKPYLPRGGGAQVLVTSNAHAWRGVATPVEIRLWPKEIGADYLVVRTGREAERTAAEALSLALGGLPLAHEQAAAYCERLDISLAEYRKRFEATPARLLDDARHAPVDYHDGLTVAKTFALAIEEAAKLHPAAEPLIVHAALLAPEPIPLFLFSEAREKFGEPLASMLLDDGLDEAVAALRALWRSLKYEDVYLKAYKTVAE